MKTKLFLLLFISCLTLVSFANCQESDRYSEFLDKYNQSQLSYKYRLEAGNLVPYEALIYLKEPWRTSMNLSKEKRLELYEYTKTPKGIQNTVMEFKFEYGENRKYVLVISYLIWFHDAVYEFSKEKIPTKYSINSDFYLTSAEKQELESLQQKFNEKNIKKSLEFQNLNNKIKQRVKNILHQFAQNVEVEMKKKLFELFELRKENQTGKKSKSNRHVSFAEKNEIIN